jgi:light-regulated signal transduction histidine kinase (bacteriophytochrome)
MQQLINDLLAYSRVETRGRDPRPVSTSAALDEAMANLRLAIEESGAEVTRGTMPTVLADAPQVTQLLQNLLSNAIKFRGEHPPRIHVDAQRNEDEWVVSVRDNGIGIDSQFTKRIFALFQRLHTREQYPGTGIGLAICKRIVERHGGRIWVESAAGEGSTFYFTFPAVETGPSPDARLQHTGAPGGEA